MQHANNQARLLYILKYLWENTDDEHMATLAQIVDHLSGVGIQAVSKTVAADIELLEQFGIDVICVKSTQNRYFIGSRVFELPEIKMLIDAVHSASFLSEKQTQKLVEEMGALVSLHQHECLRRNLVVSKPKINNHKLFYTIDALNFAIDQKKIVHFQYAKYDRDGKRSLKYKGYTYTFSPMAIVWNMDSYYVVGFPKSGEKLVSYRIDKIESLTISDVDSNADYDFDLSEEIQSKFLMFGEASEQVTLSCTYDVMDRIIDRFGEDIKINPKDDKCFEVMVEVSVLSSMIGNQYYVISDYGKQWMTEHEMEYDWYNDDEEMPFAAYKVLRSKKGTHEIEKDRCLKTIQTDAKSFGRYDYASFFFRSSHVNCFGQLDKVRCKRRDEKNQRRNIFVWKSLL